LTHTEGSPSSPEQKVSSEEEEKFDSSLSTVMAACSVVPDAGDGASKYIVICYCIWDICTGCDGVFSLENRTGNQRFEAFELQCSQVRTWQDMVLCVSNKAMCL